MHRIQATLFCAALACASACSTAQGPDPGRGYNQPVFEFNDTLDVYIVGPVARGWDWLAPQFVLTGIDNFFRTMEVPRTFVNDLLQAKPIAAGNDMGRFLVNITVGVAGFVDVASKLGIHDNDEDFGQTLGYWGTPSGAYMLLPILPFRCTVRDWVVYPLDYALNPVFIVSLVFDAPIYGTGVVDVINRRAINNDQIEENRREAIDWYVFVRDACLQNRDGAVHDTESRKRNEKEEDLYEIEE